MASIDDVFSLLKAVNEVTLKRMEDLTKAINEVTLKRMEGEILAIKTKGTSEQPLEHGTLRSLIRGGG